MAWQQLEYTTRQEINKPWARYRAEGGQSIPSSTDTQLQFVYEEFATPFVTPGGTNNNYFTLTPGLWFIIASFRLGGTPTNTLVLDIGTGTTVSAANTSNIAGGVGQVQARLLLPLSTSQSIWVKAWQSSGTARTVAVYGSATSVKMVRLAEF